MTFRPKKVSPEELQELCLDARRQFYRWSSIFERVVDRKANVRSPLMLGVYLGLNIRAHFDIDLRQGLRWARAWESGTKSMSRCRFELAGPADDADLRHILAATPMPGQIAVSFRREPSYFAGARVDGRFRQVVAARELASGRLVGFGSRSLMLRWVNGLPETIGYLSSLRLLPAHRNRGLLPRGYAMIRRLHRDGQTCLYLTTIAEGNRKAVEQLTSGRAGLPAYHFAGCYHTLALPLNGKQSRRVDISGVEIRPAQADELGRLVELLREEGARKQFFPLYEGDDFGTETGIFKDLRADDILLAWRGQDLLGVLAGWNQRGFRQTVVDGYGRIMNGVRPLYNLWARWRGMPTLPPAGEAFRYLTAALPIVRDDDPRVFAALVETLRARAAGTYGYLLLGLHEANPLFAVARRWRAAWYTTRLYLVCWQDGDELRKGLDGRPPYLELGCL